jgi:hypothetical protein
MAPQEYENLIRRLAEIHWKNLQVIAKQDPTRTRLQQALELDSVLQQVSARALLAFCTDVEARYGGANGWHA